ncbi:hypothetical protein IWQ60_001738 [Tieghemiomyces parasiticus]|uniref:Uncharacterized protein n=1 Tax=Tieghemiomyces parasiticus TaxID=78921 RepID=A0A9W8ADE7_9FUNG|nr:hypothetical protein IWQ60_001738 [Tieghemiomyces parasiticus]
MYLRYELFGLAVLATMAVATPTDNFMNVFDTTVNSLNGRVTMKDKFTQELAKVYGLVAHEFATFYIGKQQPERVALTGTPVAQLGQSNINMADWDPNEEKTVSQFTIDHPWLSSRTWYFSPKITTLIGVLTRTVSKPRQSVDWKSLAESTLTRAGVEYANGGPSISYSADDHEAFVYNYLLPLLYAQSDGKGSSAHSQFFNQVPGWFYYNRSDDGARLNDEQKMMLHLALSILWGTELGVRDLYHKELLRSKYFEEVKSGLPSILHCAKELQFRKAEELLEKLNVVPSADGGHLRCQRFQLEHNLLLDSSGKTATVKELLKE